MNKTPGDNFPPVQLIMGKAYFTALPPVPEFKETRELPTSEVAKIFKANESDLLQTSADIVLAGLFFALGWYLYDVIKNKSRL